MIFQKVLVQLDELFLRYLVQRTVGTNMQTAQRKSQEMEKPSVFDLVMS
jgi:hypothetical protein